MASATRPKRFHSPTKSHRKRFHCLIHYSLHMDWMLNPLRQQHNNNICYRCKESSEQIIENGKQWMKKEVMEAFKKYMKETGRFRGAEFELDELLYQCLSVETYEKTFHHYNFTVKTKQAGSDKWSSTLYFAQVKEMYGRKYYFCYPLDPFEEGFCHACKNQGMDALKHPAVPISYETGQADMGRPFFDDGADTGCPFFDDSSDDGDRVPDDEGMAWAFSQAFLGGVPY